MSADFELAPITNPEHPNRALRAVLCPICQRAFRPWRNAQAGVYCTLRCAGRARRLEPSDTPVDPEEIVAHCRAALAELNALVAERGMS